MNTTMVSMGSGLADSEVRVAMKRDGGMRDGGMLNGKPLRAAAVPGAIDLEMAWAQRVARDKAARFLYAVATTGVFCRVGCGAGCRDENIPTLGRRKKPWRRGFPGLFALPALEGGSWG